MKYVSLIVLAATIGVANLASAADLTLKVQEDSWYYPFNGSRGNRTNIPVFAAPVAPGPQSFHFHDAVMIALFGPDSTTPEYALGLSPADYDFSSVKVTLNHSTASAVTEGVYTWELGVTPGSEYNGVALPLYLNIHGLGSTSVDLSTFGETSSYTGLAGVPTGVPRQPYPLNIDDAATTQSVTEIPAPTSWGTVTVSPAYTPGVANASTFPVEFDLTVSNPRVKQYIREGLASGRLFFTIISNAPASQTGATNTYPRFEANNLAGKPSANNPAQANPNAATITFTGFTVASTSVDQWEMYQ